MENNQQGLYNEIYSIFQDKCKQIIVLKNNGGIWQKLEEIN